MYHQFKQHNYFDDLITSIDNDDKCKKIANNAYNYAINNFDLNKIIDYTWNKISNKI